MTGARADQPVLVLTERAVAVRAALEPTAWLVLEELALRAVPVDGQVVAEQSARTVAESVGRSKDAVARALRQLVDAGLIERGESRHGFSGRFTGGHYVVDLRTAGLRLPSAAVDAPPPPPPPVVARRRPSPSPTPVDMRRPDSPPPPVAPRRAEPSPTLVAPPRPDLPPPPSAPRESFVGAHDPRSRRLS